MKKLCLLILIVIFVIPTFAQNEKGYVYLKNGSILMGKYKYSDDLTKLQLTTASNVWIFNATEVDSIVNFRKRRLQSNTSAHSNTPFFIRSEIGVLAGSSDNSQTAPFSFSTSINYKIESLTSIGIGTGVEFLKESYLPVFLNVEYRWRNDYSTPYFFLKSGYMFPLGESNEIYYYDYMPWSSAWPSYTQALDPKGGLMINPGVGYQWMYSSSIGMSFAFGYQFHRLHYKGTQDYGLDIDYNRLTIKLGIIFK